MLEKAATDEKKERGISLVTSWEAFLDKERRGRCGNESQGRNEETHGICTTKKF